MIKAVELWNFQSHKHSRVEFHEGVNAIVGLSDSGKTALLRAMNWAVNNRPTGDAFQSYWGGDTQVTVELEGAVSVSRIRTKSDNRYEIRRHIGTIDEEAQVFRAFGQDVPAEVRAVFQLNDINIQAQMDGPFLIGSSPGEVAQILNRVVNLDVIDRAMSNIRRTKLDVDKKLKFEQDRGEELEQTLAGFAYLDPLESKIMAGEQLFGSKVAIDRQIKGLAQTIETVGQLRTKMESAQVLLRAESCVCSAIDSLDQWRGLQRNIKKLQEAVSLYLSRSVDLEAAKVLSDSEANLCAAEDRLEELEKVRAQIKRLSWIINGVQEAEKTWRSKEDEVRELSEDLEEAMPDVCPLCLQTIPRREK